MNLLNFENPSSPLYKTTMSRIEDTMREYNTKDLEQLSKITRWNNNRFVNRAFDCINKIPNLSFTEKVNQSNLSKLFNRVELTIEDLSLITMLIENNIPGPEKLIHNFLLRSIDELNRGPLFHFPLSQDQYSRLKTLLC